jgi:hypothetical protein
MGDDLGTLVICAEGCLVFLSDKKFERLEHSENCLLANLAASAESIFLRTMFSKA